MRLLLLFFGYMSFEAMLSSGIYLNSTGSIVRYASKMDELFILLLFTLAVLFSMRGHLRKYVKFNIALSLLLFSIVISSVVNLVSIPVTSEFILRYGKIPIIVLYILSANIDRNKLFQIISKYVVWIALLQFATNLLWFLNINIIPNKILDSADDWAVGTFGNTLTVAFVALIAISSILYKLYYVKMPRGKRNWNIFIVLLLIIQIYWSRSHHLTVIGLVVFMVIGLLNILSTRKNIFRIVIISILVGSVGGKYVLNSRYVNINHQIERLSLSPKWIATSESIFMIPTFAPFSIFGVGPGQGGSFLAKENPSPITQNIFLPFESAKIRQGSIITLTFTGINTIASELGLVGLTWFLAVFIAMNLLIFKNDGSRGNPLLLARKMTIITVVDIYFLESIMIDLFQHTIIPVLLAFYIACLIQGATRSSNPATHKIIKP